MKYTEWILVFPLVAMLAGCFGCPPPGDKNHRHEFTAHFEMVRIAYMEAGYEWKNPDFGELHISILSGDDAEDSCTQGGPTVDACYRHRPYLCDRIVVSSADEEQWKAAMHEILHWVLEEHGFESSNHGVDFPDFFPIQYEAWDLFEERFPDRVSE